MGDVNHFDVNDHSRCHYYDHLNYYYHFHQKDSYPQTRVHLSCRGYDYGSQNVHYPNVNGHHYHHQTYDRVRDQMCDHVRNLSHCLSQNRCPNLNRYLNQSHCLNQNRCLNLNHSQNLNLFLNQNHGQRLTGWLDHCLRQNH